MRLNPCHQPAFEAGAFPQLATWAKDALEAKVDDDST